jgi:hypothetical protein
MLKFKSKKSIEDDLLKKAQKMKSYFKAQAWCKQPTLARHERLGLTFLLLFFVKEKNVNEINFLSEL